MTDTALCAAILGTAAIVGLGMRAADVKTGDGVAKASGGMGNCGAMWIATDDDL
jgi:hypothetical protein